MSLLLDSVVNHLGDFFTLSCDDFFELHKVPWGFIFLGWYHFFQLGILVIWAFISSLLSIFPVLLMLAFFCLVSWSVGLVALIGLLLDELGVSECLLIKNVKSVIFFAIDSFLSALFWYCDLWFLCHVCQSTVHLYCISMWCFGLSIGWHCGEQYRLLCVCGMSVQSL